MSLPGVTNGQRFCQRCGTALGGGRCPLHEFDVSFRAPRETPPAPRSIRPWSSATASSAPPTWASAVTPAPTVAPVDHSSWQSSPVAPRKSSLGWLGPVALAVVVVLIIALIADHLVLQNGIDTNQRALNALDQRLAAQLSATNALAARVAALTAEPAAVAAHVRASVYTINTSEGLGSGWVVSSAGGSSELVTDYHVVQSVWTGSGAHTVQVEQNTTTLTGTITKVDPGDDLALVTVKASLTALARSTTAAMIGDAVLVVGSPLGLSGTVANGIVSSFRNGLIQFSAPISPGDSGGPVVNSAGQVIGVAESKLVGAGVEGLSFAIPIATVCSTVSSC